MKLAYQIDDHDCIVNTDPDLEFTTGKAGVLSSRYEDLALDQSWGTSGYTIMSFESVFSIIDVKRDITQILRTIIAELSPSVDLTEFTLETYHHFVDDEMHYKVIQKRDVYTHKILESMNSV